MKRLKQILLTMVFASGNVLCSYAADEYRPDRAMLKAVFEFMTYCGYMILAFGIGTLILSFRNMDGPLKSKALKTIGIAAGLLICKRIAMIFHLID